MKKYIAILISAIISLSLFACGSGQVESEDITESQTEATVASLASKDELLATAEATTLWAMVEDTNSNIARASNTYVGNTYLVWGRVSEISADYVDVGLEYGVCLRAYLPADSILSLNKADVIQIVGTVSEINEDSVFVMNNAYFVSNDYVVTDAMITSAVLQLDGRTSFTVEDENFGHINIVFYLNDDDRWLAYSSNYPYYTMSASGKMTYNYNNYVFELNCDNATYEKWR